MNDQTFKLCKIVEHIANTVGLPGCAAEVHQLYNDGDKGTVSLRPFPGLHQMYEQCEGCNSAEQHRADCLPKLRRVAEVPATYTQCEAFDQTLREMAEEHATELGKANARVAELERQLGEVTSGAICQSDTTQAFEKQLARIRGIVEADGEWKHNDPERTRGDGQMRLQLRAVAALLGVGS